MPTTSVYHWARIRSEAHNFQKLAGELEETTIPALVRAGGAPWVTAVGMFGLWTNEVVLVSSWPGGGSPGDMLSANLPESASVVEQYQLTPTGRPTTDTPLTRPGIYVHRLFEVAGADVDRFVELSNEAWTTFENSADYQAEPQGLFRQREHPATGGLMLLITWYDRLESWERSRTPRPEAEGNFRARAQLTRKSMAYATRLVGTPGVPRGMGPA